MQKEGPWVGATVLAPAPLVFRPNYAAKSRVLQIEFYALYITVILIRDPEDFCDDRACEVSARVS
jgi:hypothetical protein